MRCVVGRDSGIIPNRLVCWACVVVRISRFDVVIEVAIVLLLPLFPRAVACSVCMYVCACRTQ